jgi:hypothetical protein
VTEHTLAGYADMMRGAELRLRSAGYLDSADMMRQFVEGLDHGTVLPDPMWCDRGRADAFGPCMGMALGELPKRFVEEHGNGPTELPPPKRVQADLNDLPKTNAEIVKLAEYARDRALDSKLPDAPQLFASYLLTHGFGRLRLRNVLLPLWKEAAECIELFGEDLHRATMLMIDHKTRLGALNYLTATTDLTEASAGYLLEEWDALHFPNQLPAPIRERALKRHRFAIGESDA